MKRLLIISSIVLFFMACNNEAGNNTANSSDKADSSKAEIAESREDRNKRIVKEGMDALNSHDFDKLTSMMTEDAVDYGDGTGHVVKGRDSINTSMKMYFAAFPDFKASDAKYFADGDQVVVLAEYSGTFKNDLGKMKATGKSFKFSDADIFTLNDEGKITSHRFIQPESTMMGQILSKKK